MRYLLESFAVGALRRGSRVEQFPGAVEGSLAAGTRRVEVVPHGARFGVVLHEVVLHEDEDVGGEHFADLTEFPALAADGGRGELRLEVGRADEAAAACFGLEVGSADKAAAASASALPLAFPLPLPLPSASAARRWRRRWRGAGVGAALASALAEARTGAVRERWVNAGVGQDEYLDFVRAGRPPEWAAGH